MHDLLVVAVAMLAFGCIGLPFSLLLPSRRFSVRWALAPPLGVGLLAAATAVFYVHGIIAPWITMTILPMGGIVLAATILVGRPFAAPRRTTVVVALAIVLIVIICLAPAWTGGQRFRVFQANVYDHMLYVGSAVAYRAVDYTHLVVQSNADLPDPIFPMALWFVDWRGAVSMMLGAIAALTRGSAVDCAYPYMVALQLNMLFAALFVFTNVLAFGRWMAAICATALAIGFFEQYIFDINAMSQLAGQPLFLLLFGFAVLALDKDRFGTGGAAVWRMIAIFAALIAGIFFLYPEPLTVYGPAIGIAAVFALRFRDSRQAVAVAAVGIGGGIAAGLLLCVPLWSGTGAYVVRVLSQAAGETPDWWNYFQRYLFGREEAYFYVIGGHSSSPGHLLDAWFSWPVEATAAALGLFALLPTSGWPVVLAIVWKLVLYGFVGMLLMNIAAAILWAWRNEPEMPRTRFLLGSIVGCLVPLGILATGHGWAAGKGLAMAAPMLFTLLISPLLTGPKNPTGIITSSLVVLCHLCLGLARPFLVAGHALPGLPTASAHVELQKAALDWDYQRISSEISACKGLVIETSNPMMDNLLRRIAVESGIPWAAPKTMSWSSKSGQDYFPSGWEQFDCLAAADRLSSGDGRKLIDLAMEHTARDFLNGRRDNLELGTKTPSGIKTTGLYGLETTPGGDLQWAGPKATFELPNRPSPARTLQFRIWPMPVSGDRIAIRINGKEIFAGSPPQSLLSRSLDEFAGDETLRLEIETNAPTHFPGDPRELGFAIRELSLRR
jgi:hypothetical protein